MCENIIFKLSGDAKITELKREIKQLKTLLQEKENQLTEMLKKSSENIEDEYCKYSKVFSTKEISRYSRQMLVPQLGFKSQINLKHSRVLIVGLGGLGCPAALYLAAAGVGAITLIDYDTVDTTNLHRQILHSESSVGEPKVNSAFKILKSINSNINIIPICATADSTTLKTLFTSNKYDVVVDGSDNVVTRYLLNDICVLNKVPLVSGSALQMEGQLTVYNYKGGPCYRCLFPTPPPPSTVTNCGDGGVLGAVPGTIGVLQALEAIKIITEMDNVLAGRLLVFDGSSTSFLDVKLRNRQKNCDVCGENPKILDLIDYEQFCQSKAHDKLSELGPRLTLQLIKIEDGLMEGEVLYHELIEKTEEEKEEIRRKRETRKRLKEKRKKVQDDNKRRKEDVKKIHKEKSLEGIKRKQMTETDVLLKKTVDESKKEAYKEVDDDVEYYRQEVGEEPDKDLFKQKKGMKRPGTFHGFKSKKYKKND